VLLTRLRRHGVADGVARGLGKSYTLAVLNKRIDLFEALVKSGQLTPKKSAAAALVHLIKNPDQYDVKAAIARTAAVQAPRVPKSEEAPTLSVTNLVDGMSPEERGAYLVRQLNLLLRGKLTTLELDALYEKAVTGELNVADVCAAVLKAKTGNQIPALLANLRASIHQADLF